MRGGLPLLKYPLNHDDNNVGITQTLTLGQVSEFECRDVCIKSNYTWTEWLELDEYERAMCIAHYRLTKAIEANVSDAMQRGSNGRRRARSR